MEEFWTFQQITVCGVEFPFFIFACLLYVRQILYLRDMPLPLNAAVCMNGNSHPVEGGLQLKLYAYFLEALLSV